MKIVYIAETSLTNKSAYSQHVIKMCDAFAQLNHDIILYLPKFNTDTKYDEIKKKFLLVAKKRILIKSLTNLKNTNSFFKLFFLIKVIYFIKKDNPELILTRSFISSIILSIFKIHHYLEIHSEFQSITKLLMLKLNYINSKYIIKKIIISEALNKIFKFKKKDYMVLHDGVDTLNFKKIKKIKKVKTITYVGNFYRGRGINLILKMATKFHNLKFNLYGQNQDNFKINLKNLKLFKFVDYFKVPTILSSADILLMPYEKKVWIRSKNVNTANYCSPLKMFDYLAAGKIIMSSKLDGICEVLKHNKNSIIVKSHNFKDWSYSLKKILTNYYNIDEIQKNALKTAKYYTWKKRASKIVENYINQKE